MTTLTTPPATQPDFVAIKTRQRQTWESGDYHIIAAMIVPMAEQLADSIELRAGEHVLDVATGTGNAAIAAARRLCGVTGVDYAPSLLARARKRAEAEDLSTITFKEEDAEELSASDGAYDVVLSALGVMFAANQARAASELVRVVRPGGRIGLVNWSPDGFIGAMLRTVGRHVPPPAGLRSPTVWGTEDGVRDLLGTGVSSLRASRETFVWRFSSPDHFLELFRSYYGPVHKAFGALQAAGQDALAADLLETVRRFARVVDGTLLVPAEYLEVVAVRS
jgi:ubiquinone/menaquinone biosynthesis C-methylase UbiE